MNKSLISFHREKKSNVICEMIQRMTGISVQTINESLVDESVEYVLRINSKNPVKDLLRLLEFLLDVFIQFRPGANLFFENYDYPCQQMFMMIKQYSLVLIVINRIFLITDMQCL